MMFTNIHKKKWARIVAAYIALNLLAEFTMPVAAFALTSGPAQEEFASFEPASTSDMVDLYTGDFTYNLPLLSVPGPNGGYPINLAYHSGIGMEQEASWVGLGWNINVGAINRNLRGLPDDFAGEVVTTKNHLKKDWTVGLNLPSLPLEKYAKEEMFGQPTNINNAPRFYSQIYYNSYRGLGVRATLADRSNKSLKLGRFQLNAGLNLVFDSQNGIGISPSLSVENQSKLLKTNIDGTYSMSFSSREGFQGSSFAGSTTLSGKVHYVKQKMSGTSSVSTNSFISFGRLSSVPSVGLPMNNTTVNFGIHFGTSVPNPPNPPAPEPFGKYYAQTYSSWSGVYNETEVANNGNENRAAYGFLNIGVGDDYENSLNDVARENIPYSKKVPNLAPSSLTYDLFSVSGQGTGGMFRPIRNQAAIISSPRKETNTKSYSADVELGAYPTTSHLGLGIAIGTGLNSSGMWINHGLLPDNQTALSGFDDEAAATLTNYEPWFFQLIGEKNGVLVGDDFLDKWGGGDAAYKIALTKSNDPDWSERQFVATDKLGTEEYNPASLTIGAGSRVKPIRAARSTNIEVNYVGDILNLQIPNIASKVNVRNGYSSSSQISRGQLLTNRPSNHIAEISMLQADGMRYNYALPAYNESQKEVTFILDQTSGLTYNTSNTPIPSSQMNVNNNSIITNNIFNEYYSESTLPSYVHSWLLTSVVSSDYVDITGNGPTEDDYGYWVKFNYVKASSLYSWRVPYHGAKYIQGNQNDPTDDMGYYTYGEKQIFLLDRIETKTHLAVFNLGDRKDSKEASGDVNANSGTGTDAMKRIESIKLYSKAEYNLNPVAAVPIKTVHFAYDYSLCPNVNNNDGTPEIVNSIDLNAAKGKLTLKKVWFSYLNSNRGQISPYQFTYSTFNPSYNEGDMDRWGNYKPNSSTYSSNGYPYLNYAVTDQMDYRNSSSPQSLESPYLNGPFANRSEELASAWALTSIRMPSGGTMDIKYELDDYSYNEDKPCVEFFDITTENATDARSGYSSPSIDFIDNSSADPTADNNYRIYFKLHETLPSSYVNDVSGSNYIKDQYLKGSSQIYFRTYTKLLGNFSLNQANSWDYVSGWADVIIDNNNLLNYVGVESPTVGYITLKKEGLNEINIINNTIGTNVPPFVHPFRKAAFRHLKSSRQELLYNAVPYANNWKEKVVNTVGTVVPVINELASILAQGFNNIAFTKGFSSEMRLNGFSVIRLSDGDGKKFGGGVRVKELTLNDHWVKSVSGNTPNEDANKYGQTYLYQMENGATSGVAYEPMLGKDESALYTPKEYPLSTKIKNPQQLYIENPVLDNYYPAPSVGYRRIIVKSIAPSLASAEASQNNLPSNSLLFSSAPISEYTFYSPKEFPVYADETDMNNDGAIYRPMLVPGFYAGLITRKARTQGYLIELNDMAGKPKSIATYTRNTNQFEEKGKLISKVEFFYDTKDPYDESRSNRLNNKVAIINPDATASNQMLYKYAVVGQSEEVFVDMNEDYQRSRTIGLDVNLDLQNTPFAFFLMPIPTTSHFEASMRTIVTHKIVHRSGLLKETVVTTDESVISTKNLAYDLETAQPILTQVTNDYKDDVYNMAYPAHWYYSGMQGAYRNYRVKLDMPANTTLSVGSSGRVDLTGLVPSGKTAHDYFEPGDEVYIDFATGSADGLYWVYKVGPNVSGNNYIDLMAANGTLVPNASTIKSLTILRSGHRNMVTASAGGVSFKTINGFTPWSASAPASGTFSFDKVINASAVQYSDFWASDCKNCSAEFGFTSDVVNPYRNGILGNWRAYKSYAYRTQRNQNDNIREDGTYADFNTFDWRNPAASHPNWILASTVTMYSPFGFELENRDPLGNYSSATYEYNSSLATMVGSNARYREIGSDGFEDYQMLNSCLTANSGSSLVNYDHWGFGGFISKLKTNEHHTGRYSLELLNGESAENNYNVFSGTEYDAIMDPLRMYQLTWNDLVSTTMPLNNPYCTGKVAYTPGKTYVVSGWVKQTGSPLPVNTASNYTSGQIQVQFYNGASLVSTQTISANDNTIIDGWQRLQGTFTVPASGVTAVKVVLRNTATMLNTPVYFDDLRVHPFDGQAKTFVYDQTTLKLMAELDENNYATFYNYDDEGHLVKVRKETREGIKTLKEGRINTRTNY